MYGIAPRRSIGFRTMRGLILASAFGLIGWLILPDRLLNKFQPTARAASPFTVNSLGDTPDATPGNGTCADASGNCTLRAAIQEANSLAGDDTINFSVTGTINLTGVLPDITSNLTMNGPGSSLLTVRRDTGGLYRIFAISNGNVNITGLTVTNGKTADGAPGNTTGGAAPNGGGILQAGGVVVLTDVVITGNSTGVGGSGTGGSNSFGGQGGFGGGLSGSGTLTMRNCVVSSNSTGNGGTGGFGVTGGYGGGIFFAVGAITLTNVSITGNRTGDGGVGTNGGLSGGNSGYGGGIYGGSFSSSSQVTTLNMTNVNISNNSTGNVVRGNAGDGGGVMIPEGTVTITNSTINNNHTGSGSGFLSGGGRGGGISNHGSLTVTNSTINGNTTGNGGDSGDGGPGGGIINGFVLVITNSTVSGNVTGGGNDGNAGGNGGQGAGIYNGTTMTMTNCTVTANLAFNNQSNGVVAGNTTNVGNTIIARNGPGGNGPDLDPSFNNNTFTSRGHNLIGNAGSANGFTNGSNGDQVGTGAAPLNPQLGPLADNGGPTLTQALLAGSPALDAGDNAVAKDASNNTLTTDQRGAARVADSPDADTTATVDIGAFEWQPSLEDITDKTTREDVALSVPFGVGDGAGSISSITAASDNQTLVPDGNLSVSGTAPVRTLQIIPAANQSGTANITITVNGSNGVMSDSFILTVTAANDAPAFTKGADVTVNEDAGPQTIPGWATGIDPGPNETGQSLTFQVTGNSNFPMFSTAPAVSPSGTLTFTPTANANGSATITLLLKDDGGTANGGQDTSAAQTFVITVTAVNDPPTANSQNLTINEDSPTFVPLSGSDVEGGPLTFTIVTGPSHGTLTGSGSSRTYTPALNFNGNDSFTFKVTDPLGADSASATVAFTINAVNDPPVNSIPVTQITNQNTSLVFSTARSNAISVSDVDADATDAIKVTLTATRGVITLGGTAGLSFVTGDGVEDLTMTFTGTIGDINAAMNGLTFKPDPGTNGAATLRITTDDQGHNGSGGARTDTDTIGITVRSGGLLQFSASTFTVNENGGVASIVVTRSTSFGAASVNYATANGSASGGGACGPGINYVTSSGTVSWADGDSNFKTFTIPICDDSLTTNGTVNLSLSNAGGSAALGTQTTATLTIINDGPPVILTELNSDHAVAFESVMMTRDPFSLVASANFNPDRRTRIMLFVWGLGFRQSDNLSDVFVQAEDVSGNVYPLPVEYLSAAPGLDGITEVVVLLPQTVLGAPRDLFVSVRLRGPVSNKATIKIAAP